jgi:DNA-binding NarL/FixJ family response regulator
VITVVVVDDHPLVRAGLRALLDGADDVGVVGEAADGESAVRLVPTLEPDVVLMDVSMPGIGGVEATRRLVDGGSAARVVVLTSFPDPATVHDALAAGATGYLLKDADPATVLDGVRAAARGDAPLDPRAARALLPTRTAPPAGPAVGPEARLVVGREADVLRLVGRGLSNRQIGHELGIAERTVKAHVGSIFRRVGVAGRTIGPWY